MCADCVVTQDKNGNNIEMEKKNRRFLCFCVLNEMDFICASWSIIKMTSYRNDFAENVKFGV